MMKTAMTVIAMLALAVLPVHAVDFLGVELCDGSTDTAVELPPASQLVLESVEIGDHGGLVMLLSARSGNVMDRVDDLMTGVTGQRGSGDDDGLEWTGGRLTAVAQRVAKRYAALAVTGTDPCTGAPSEPAVETAGPPAAEPTAAVAHDDGGSAPTPAPDREGEAAVVAAVPPVEAEYGATGLPAPAAKPTAAPLPDFELVGELALDAADDTWVDVMGVVANHSAINYRLAAFDVAVVATDGSLVCVDTISVSVLKGGQERAFRDAIRCPGYEPAAVADIRFEFAGGD